jgi:hypothetical protein
MPRKSTPRSGTTSSGGNVIDRIDVSSSIPPTPSEARPGSSVSLEMVNVFGEPVAETTGGGPGARLHLTAWVNNVSYVKDVWVDAYLTDPSGAVVHTETLLLDYHEGAGGGGDFFVLDAPVQIPGRATIPVTRLLYRLYYQIGDTIYAEGILHEHELAAVTAKVVAADAKPKARAKSAPAKASAPAPEPASGDSEAPVKRITRRRSSA